MSRTELIGKNKSTLRNTQDKEIERIQSTFSKWVDALKHHYQRDSQSLLIKIGQLYVAIQKINKPSYPEIQDCATATETIKNIDQALLQLASILEDQKTPFSPSILETTQESLQKLRGEITGRIFYRLETLLEPYRRESIVSTSSVMYQNMNITTEFPSTSMQSSILPLKWNFVITPSISIIRSLTAKCHAEKLLPSIVKEKPNS